MAVVHTLGVPLLLLYLALELDMKQSMVPEPKGILPLFPLPPPLPMHLSPHLDMHPDMGLALEWKLVLQQDKLLMMILTLLLDMGLEQEDKILSYRLVKQLPTSSR